jgi:hypothetical protein
LALPTAIALPTLVGRSVSEQYMHAGLNARLPGTGTKRRMTLRRMNSIVTRRLGLVSELAVLRQQGAESKFMDNAQQLLTRWWSRASWDAREELLKSADWLIRLQKNHAPPAEPSA